MAEASQDAEPIIGDLPLIDLDVVPTEPDATEIPGEIGTNNSPTVQPTVNNDSTAPEVINPRPQRNIRRPSYLDDFICDNIITDYSPVLSPRKKVDEKVSNRKLETEKDIPKKLYSELFTPQEEGADNSWFSGAKPAARVSNTKLPSHSDIIQRTDNSQTSDTKTATEIPKTELPSLSKMMQRTDNSYGSELAPRQMTGADPRLVHDGITNGRGLENGLSEINHNSTRPFRCCLHQDKTYLSRFPKTISNHPAPDRTTTASNHANTRTNR
jgi:hypothetical protein